MVYRCYILRLKNPGKYGQNHKHFIMKQVALILLILFGSVFQSNSQDLGHWQITLNYNQLFVVEDETYPVPFEFGALWEDGNEIIRSSKKYSYGFGFNMTRKWERIDMSFGVNVMSKNFNQDRSCNICGSFIPYTFELSTTAFEVPLTVNFYPLNENFKWYLGIGINNLLTNQSFTIDGFNEEESNFSYKIGLMPQTGVKILLNDWSFIHGALMYNYELVEVDWNRAGVFQGRDESLNFDYWGFRLGFGFLL